MLYLPGEGQTTISAEAVTHHAQLSAAYEELLRLKGLLTQFPEDEREISKQMRVQKAHIEDLRRNLPAGAILK